MRRKNNLFPGMRCAVLGGAMLLSFSALAADNMRVRGALVAQPCVIAPGDESLQLDFGSVQEKFLYLNRRTPGRSFQLHLTDCNLSLGKTVNITFNGIESLALPGLLALDGASQASGIAIGMEASDGQPILLNKRGADNPLVAGDNVISITAYVEGEPKAIADRTIGVGSFGAAATFNLDYE